MNKHTPGPWGVSFNGKGTWIIEEVGGDHQYVARTERQQNARLIAASPDMAAHISLMLRTVNDTLRHGLTDGQREVLEDICKEGCAVLAKANLR